MHHGIYETPLDLNDLGIRLDATTSIFIVGRKFGVVNYKEFERLLTNIMELTP